MKIIIIVTIFFVTINLQSQNNQLENNIDKSLMSFFEKLKNNREKGIIDQEYFNNLYLSIDNYPPHFYFNDSISKQIKFISLINYRGHEKNLKNGIWVIFLSHLELRDNRFFIGYTLKKVTLKKKNHLVIGLSDSVIFTYEYSCDNNNWILVNTEYSGI